MLYRVSDLELIQNTVLDVSPAILIPHYDHDSSTLFLTSKVCMYVIHYSFDQSLIIMENHFHDREIDFLENI